MALIAKFLGKDLTDGDLDAITKHCSFESMSVNKNCNFEANNKGVFDMTKEKFMRKGQVGDWKNYFTINESSAFDRMYEEKMKGKDLKIDFEI